MKVILGRLYYLDYFNCVSLVRLVKFLGSKAPLGLVTVSESVSELLTKKLENAKSRKI